jgi:hypothetical protein
VSEVLGANAFPCLRPGACDSSVACFWRLNQDWKDRFHRPEEILSVLDDENWNGIGIRIETKTLRRFRSKVHSAKVSQTPNAVRSGIGQPEWHPEDGCRPAHLNLLVSGRHSYQPRPACCRGRPTHAHKIGWIMKHPTRFTITFLMGRQRAVRVPIAIGLTSPSLVARSSSGKRASMSSISIALAAWLSRLSAVRRRHDGGEFGSILIFQKRLGARRFSSKATKIATKKTSSLRAQLRHGAVGDPRTAREFRVHETPYALCTVAKRSAEANRDRQ